MRLKELNDWNIEEMDDDRMVKVPIVRSKPVGPVCSVVQP